MLAYDRRGSMADEAQAEHVVPGVWLARAHSHSVGLGSGWQVLRAAHQTTFLFSGWPLGK